MIKPKKGPDEVWVVIREGAPVSVSFVEIPFDKPMREAGWQCQLYVLGDRYYDLKAEVERLCTITKEM